MTSPENPYFARAMVNRTWWRLFGRGIVNPVDDMHAANPPSHPELLDLLARRFAESGFDLKFLTRAIVSSRAYQRTSRPGDAAGEAGRAVRPDGGQGPLGRAVVRLAGDGPRPAGEDARESIPRQDAAAEFVAVLRRRRRPRPDRVPAGHPAPAAADELGAVRRAERRRPGRRGWRSRAGRRTRSPADLFLASCRGARRPTKQRLFRAYAGPVPARAEAACRELAWALMMTSEFSLNH